MRGASSPKRTGPAPTSRVMNLSGTWRLAQLAAGYKATGPDVPASAGSTCLCRVLRCRSAKRERTGALTSPRVDHVKQVELVAVILVEPGVAESNSPRPVRRESAGAYQELRYPSLGASVRLIHGNVDRAVSMCPVSKKGGRQRPTDAYTTRDRRRSELGRRIETFGRSCVP